MREYSAVSVFSGCGGFCEGARLAGFRAVAAVENDRFSAETYRYNFPEVPLFENDIRAFLNPSDERWCSEAARFAHLNEGRVDLVFGGPPCQGYSQIGTRILDDPRNRLYAEFVRVVVRLRPPVFLMENVPNMLLLAKGRFKREVLSAFAEAGYANTSVRILDASQVGVPQQRRRAVFLGVRDDVGFPYNPGDWIEKTLESERSAGPTVWEAIGDLPEEVASSLEPLPYPEMKEGNALLDELRLDGDGRFYTSEYKTGRAGGMLLHNHHTKDMQERRRKLVSHLKPGLKGDSLPGEIWSGKRPEKWRRLHPDRPAYTILAQMHRDLSEWVHPRHARWITVREAARLQSFHDGFVFRSSEWQMLKQVGNAVPPLLGRAVALSARGVLEYLDGNAACDRGSDTRERQLVLRLAPKSVRQGG